MTTRNQSVKEKKSEPKLTKPKKPKNSAGAAGADESEDTVVSSN